MSDAMPMSPGGMPPGAAGAAGPPPLPGGAGAPGMSPAAGANPMLMLAKLLRKGKSKKSRSKKGKK